MALNEESLFETLFQELNSLSGQRPFKKSTTGTGGLIAEAPTDSHLPHLALVGSNPYRSQQVVGWCQKNLYTTVLVSCDAYRPLHHEDSYFIPQLCMRSVGRIDPRGAPIIFEEILFDGGVQSEISMKLTGRGPLPDVKLFGSNKSPLTLKEMEWLHSTTSCQAIDYTTAELMIIGKRLSMKVGCFKFNAEKPELLLKSWHAILAS